MAFTAKDVQALREKTGCGMMDCKKALTECNGDMDKAVDFLREKGLAQQAKKSTRIAAEGAVLVYEADGVAAAVEINAETDFVAGGDLFKDLTKKVAQVVAEVNPADVEALGNCTLDGKTVNEAVQDLFLAVRENIKIRRFERFEGVVGSYVHGGGKIGVLVNFETTPEIAATEEFKTLAKDIAMQIAAVNPTYLDRDSVPADAIEHEKGIMISQMKEDPKMANKPEQVLAKIVEGKLGKFFSEVCLIEQEFVKNGDFKVGAYIEAEAKKLGGEIKLVKFARLEKGEGLEKRNDNFADEVASMVK